MKEKDLPVVDNVTYFRAEDGRLIGMYVNNNFSDFAAFPPYVKEEKERAFINTAYEVSNINRERDTKAHITPDEYPLQITILNRDPGAVVKAHYHKNYEPFEGQTRHQIMICQRGKAIISVYTIQGDHVGDATLLPGDLILMTEGHRIEFVEPNTKMIEVKQGPIPEHIADEMFVL